MRSGAPVPLQQMLLCEPCDLAQPVRMSASELQLSPEFALNPSFREKLTSLRPVETQPFGLVQVYTLSPRGKKQKVNYADGRGVGPKTQSEVGY